MYFFFPKLIKVPSERYVKYVGECYMHVAKVTEKNKKQKKTLFYRGDQPIFVYRGDQPIFCVFIFVIFLLLILPKSC